jgi:hypothetical protein
MSKQPKALSLADGLNQFFGGYPIPDEAAAELRRLHELNGELLEVLKACVQYGSMTGDEWVLEQANAAITKAEAA